jgi:hypothetical protein
MKVKYNFVNKIINGFKIQFVLVIKMSERVNITIPKDFLLKVDEFSKKEHRKRSELIREALREYMGRRDKNIAVEQRKGPIYSEAKETITVEKIKKISKEKKAELFSIMKVYFKNRPEVIASFIFGSYSTDNATILSDLDVGILLKIDIGKDKYSELLLDISSDLVKLLKMDNIDLVILNRANPILKYEIATKGMAIFEREKEIVDNFKIKSLKYYMDTKKFRNLYQKSIKNFLLENKI